MRRGAMLALVLLLGGAAGARAQEQEALPKDSVPKEWTFIGYSFTRTTASNITPSNDILQGQVIGRLFGPNSTVTGDSLSFFTEQRFVPYFMYRPKILDGWALFRFMGKIDYTWGDQAYGVGGNRGGAINGGQINLQTLMASVDIRPSKTLNFVVGLQRLFDNAYDPNYTTLTQSQTSGYKMMFWGTNAVGANMYSIPKPGMRLRLGWFPLWSNAIARDDGVNLFMADLDTRLAPKLEVGADAWYVRDRGRGGGGITILSEGLNSPLAEYNGAARLRFPSTASTYIADIVWLGGRTAYNRDFLAGRWWADAFAIANVGRIDTVGTSTTAHAANLLGVAANASLAYKYGMTANDKVWAEATFTTGDGGSIASGKSNVVVTGNVWGSPVGIYSSHHAFLLFPDPQVVNRYYSAVQDISNAGNGLTGFAANASRDLIPNRFSARLGAATAFSNTIPEDGGSYIGSEINAELKYNFKVFLTGGLSAGYLKLGNYYDAPSVTYDHKRPMNAWVVFASLSWLMF